MSRLLHHHRDGRVSSITITMVGSPPSPSWSLMGSEEEGEMKYEGSFNGLRGSFDGRRESFPGVFIRHFSTPFPKNITIHRRNITVRQRVAVSHLPSSGSLDGRWTHRRLNFSENFFCFLSQKYHHLSKKCHHTPTFDGCPS
eukprot:jgi/Botrbrau1/18855/Bobra.177_2s0017.1